MSKEVNKKDQAVRNARKAQKAMLAYMEDNKLDPNKDWTKDKKHGKKIQEWIDIINLGNKKAREINEEKAIENSKKKKDKKPEAHPKKEKVTGAPNMYDYPTVDGKEMNPDQKKKYRQKMRTLLKTMSKEKAESEALVYVKDMFAKATPMPLKPKKVESKEPKKEKANKEEKKEKVNKVKEEKKPEKKKDKKKKKIAKEED